jgi:hypothetical protein
VANQLKFIWSHRYSIEVYVAILMWCPYKLQLVVLLQCCPHKLILRYCHTNSNCPHKLILRYGHINFIWYHITSICSGDHIASIYLGMTTSHPQYAHVICLCAHKHINLYRPYLIFYFSTLKLRYIVVLLQCYQLKFMWTNWHPVPHHINMHWWR